MDKNSNQIWANSLNYKGFEQRAYRFTDEMRPMFYKWLGIDGRSHVLDAGCGTGVFGRYLAGGLTGGLAGGHVTGFDINEGFIEYGRVLLNELSLADKMTLELADGYNLHYVDDMFDAVTNYTYIGVLSDPVAGLRELIRVCKHGGTVSCVVASNTLPAVWWQGDYPFDGADELQNLSAAENEIFCRYAQRNATAVFHQSAEWGALRYPRLLHECGLGRIILRPYAYAFNYSDGEIPLEYRKNLLCDETESEIEWLASRYEEHKSIYNEHGFHDKDFKRMTALLEAKAEYVRNRFENDMSFEWRGGYNFIVAGVKS